MKKAQNPSQIKSEIAKFKLNQKKTLENKQQDMFVPDPFEQFERLKNSVRKKTGLIHNEKNVQHKCNWDKNYPECPDRYIRIIEKIKEAGLYNECEIFEQENVVKEEIIESCHDKKLIQILKDVKLKDNIDEAKQMSSNFDSIYMNSGTYNTAIEAVDCCLTLATKILDNSVHNGFAIVRPPGHHAMHNLFNGYCFFNNVAITAKYLIDNKSLERIMIIDLDVHHGQGTQQMFYENGKTVYFSIHRYENKTFWPNLDCSNYDYIGYGDGAGKNFNFPLNETKVNDADYLAIFDYLLKPILYEYKPELIIVSMGFDSAIGDPEGEMLVTPLGFGHLIQQLSVFAEGKVMLVLEGGYNLEMLAEAAAMSLHALLNRPLRNIKNLPDPKPSITEMILKCARAHSNYWNCFSQFANNEQILPRELDLNDLKFDEIPYQTENCYPEINQKNSDEYNKRREDILETDNQVLSLKNKVLIYYDQRHFLHNEKHFLENADRVETTVQLLEELNILNRCTFIKEYNKKNMLETKNITDLVHSEQYIDLIKKIIHGEEKNIFRSIEFNKHTFELAILAASCAVDAMRNLFDHNYSSVFALIRPPGHHAEIGSTSGFCFINNVAMAAKKAKSEYNVKRTLIIDIDAHFGNGTQDIFNEDSSVMVISIHRHDNGRFFPSSQKGGAQFNGENNGKGYTINIPWNKSQVGDGDYIEAFNRVVIPISRKFCPDFVIVSAGYDAAVGDPLGKCNITPEGFGHIIHMISGVSNGRLLLCLEGGYNKESVAKCVTSSIKSLLGDPLSIIDNVSVFKESLDSINETIAHNKNIWKTIDFPVKD